MSRYLLAFALLASAAYVGASLLGVVVEHRPPSFLDLSLAGGVYTMAIAARVTL